MGCRSGGAASFSSDTYERKAVVTAATPEKAFSGGKQTLRTTGKLHQFVEPKRPKISRTSSTYLGNGRWLVNFGAGRSIVMFVDSTYSYRESYPAVIQGLAMIHGLVSRVLVGDWNLQFAFGLIQDKDDNNGPIQVTEYEAAADKCIDQIDQLAPDDDGGDVTEDYQYIMAKLLWGTETSCLRYGIKPYGAVMCDQMGRENLSGSLVNQFLGIQVSDMSVYDLGRLFTEKFNFFCQLTSSSSSIKRWWTRVLGQGRVVSLDNPRHSAGLNAVLFWASQVNSFTEAEVVEFLVDGTAKAQIKGNRLSKYDAQVIYRSVIEAGVPFGTQRDVPKPLPGDIMDHHQNYFPIGHPLYVPWQKLGLLDPEQPTPFTPNIDIKPWQKVYEERGIAVTPEMMQAAMAWTGNGGVASGEDSSSVVVYPPTVDVEPPTSPKPADDDTNWLAEF